MSVELRVPEVGESITEVQIGAWLKSEGDRVERDEALVEIESDKATLELPAPVAGTLSRVIHKRGDIVKVGDLIAELIEGRAAGNGAKAEPKPGSKGSPANEPAAGAAHATAAAPLPPSAAPVAARGGAVPRVMPAAQRALADAGLAAGEVHATGPAVAS